MNGVANPEGASVVQSGMKQPHSFEDYAYLFAWYKSHPLIRSNQNFTQISA